MAERRVVLLAPDPEAGQKFDLVDQRVTGLGVIVELRNRETGRVRIVNANRLRDPWY